MVECCICQRLLGEGEGVTIRLTAEEKAYVNGMTSKESPAEFVYCRPCHRVLTDREAGAQLLKGAMARELHSFGVAGAEQVAERYYNFLIRRAAAGPVS